MHKNIAKVLMLVVLSFVVVFSAVMLTSCRNDYYDNLVLQVYAPRTGLVGGDVRVEHNGVHLVGSPELEVGDSLEFSWEVMDGYDVSVYIDGTLRQSPFTHVVTRADFVRVSSEEETRYFEVRAILFHSVTVEAPPQNVTRFDVLQDGTALSHNTLHRIEDGESLRVEFSSSQNFRVILFVNGQSRALTPANPFVTILENTTLSVVAEEIVMHSFSLTPPTIGGGLLGFNVTKNGIAMTNFNISEIEDGTILGFSWTLVPLLYEAVLYNGTIAIGGSPQVSINHVVRGDVNFSFVVRALPRHIITTLAPQEGVSNVVVTANGEEVEDTVSFLTTTEVRVTVAWESEYIFDTALYVNNTPVLHSSVGLSHIAHFYLDDLDLSDAGDNVEIEVRSTLRYFTVTINNESTDGEIYGVSVTRGVDIPVVHNSTVQARTVLTISFNTTAGNFVLVYINDIPTVIQSGDTHQVMSATQIRLVPGEIRPEEVTIVAPSYGLIDLGSLVVTVAGNAITTGAEINTGSLVTVHWGVRAIGYYVVLMINGVESSQTSGHQFILFGETTISLEIRNMYWGVVIGFDESHNPSALTQELRVVLADGGLELNAIDSVREGRYVIVTWERSNPQWNITLFINGLATTHESGVQIRILENTWFHLSFEFLAPQTNEAGQRIVYQSQVMIFETPGGVLNRSEEMSVQVAGQDVFVHDVAVNHQRSFHWGRSAYFSQVVKFDFIGTITVEVTVNDRHQNITNAVVRPLARGVETQVNGNVISFELEHWGPYTLEFSSDIEPRAYRNVLHIFTNEIEQNPICPDNIPENYIFIGPGVWYTGAIAMLPGQTLYLAGGAFVYGHIRTDGVNDITIRGRGILAGDIWERRNDPEFTLPFEIRQAYNVEIRDITILDPAGWAITIMNSDNVRINNVNIITSRANGDGISIQTSRNVDVKGGFVRAWDDALVVKAVVEADPQGIRGTENITFRDVVLWVDLAQAMEVGYEAFGSYQRNIVFDNITVLYAHHLAPISINNGDNAYVYNVQFTNITIEEALMATPEGQAGSNESLFLNFRTTFHPVWSTIPNMTQLGPIGQNRAGQSGVNQQILVDNIRVLNMLENGWGSPRGIVPSNISAAHANGHVSNITMRNIEINGQRIQNFGQLNFNNIVDAHHVDQDSIRFEAGTATINGARLSALPYENRSQNSVALVQVVVPASQNGVPVPGALLGHDVELAFRGMPINIDGVRAEAYREVGRHFNQGWPTNPAGVPTAPTTRPDELPWNMTHYEDGHHPNNLFDGRNDTTWRTPAFTGEENEFTALRVIFGETDANGFFPPASRRAAAFARFHLPETRYVHEFRVRVIAGFNNSSWQNQQAVAETSFISSPLSGNIIDIPLGGIGNSPQGMVVFKFYHLPNSVLQPEFLEFTKLEFLPTSLTRGARAFSSVEHGDVYVVSNLVDGVFVAPSYFQVHDRYMLEETYVILDMRQVQTMHIISLFLPPQPQWEPRRQTFEIRVSTHAAPADVPFNSIPRDSFTTIVERQQFLFDFNGMFGEANNNVIHINSQDFIGGLPVNARFIQIIGYRNESWRAEHNEFRVMFGWQLSEIQVF